LARPISLILHLFRLAGTQLSFRKDYLPPLVRHLDPSKSLTNHQTKHKLALKTSYTKELSYIRKVNTKEVVRCIPPWQETINQSQETPKDNDGTMIYPQGSLAC
jgi:hypothetical protein